MSGKFRRVARSAPGLLKNAARRRRRLAGGQLTDGQWAGDAGMSTAEYAVGTVAACGFAAVLYKVVTSGSVGSELQQLIERALDAQF